jgi:hypothetical protein
MVKLDAGLAKVRAKNDALSNEIAENDYSIEKKNRELLSTDAQMISYQKSLEDQQRENDALKCDNSMIKEELLVLGKRKLDQIQQSCAVKASQISELDRTIHSQEEKLYMLTHQSKLMMKEEEEYQRVYNLNKDKRDQLANQA